MILTTMIKRFGFTLAEVLIVIGIIGVVANMTIPTLINNIQNQENIIMYKKVYSGISASVKMVMNEYGQDNINGLLATGTDSEPFVVALKNYLAISKICGANATNGICFHSNSNWKHLNNSSIDGSTITHETHDVQGAMLQNGVLMKWCTHNCANGSPSCADFFIDANGFKGPNTVGKDIFAVAITQDNKILPFGTQGDAYYGTCTTSSTGYGCSAEVLYK